MKPRASRLARCAFVALAALPLVGAAQELTLPNQGQVRFAVIGDMGTASRAQREVAQQMGRFHGKFPFTFVISVEVPGGLRFFALDSNYMDAPQLAWLERELSASGSDWKLAFFHHPLYSSGRTHGSSLDLRKTLEPLFTRYGIDVVFAGHATSTSG